MPSNIKPSGQASQKNTEGHMRKRKKNVLERKRSEKKQPQIKVAPAMVSP